MSWSKSLPYGKAPRFPSPSRSTHLGDRGQEEDAQFGEDTLRSLSSIANESNLRYALNLISTANVISKKRRSEKIDIQDVKRAYVYFLDLPRSQKWLKGQAAQSLLFWEGEQQSTSGDKMDQS
jgi:RuvB-like protein 2